MPLCPQVVQEDERRAPLTFRLDRMSMDSDVVRGHVRDPLYLRVSHGLFLRRVPL